jgi:hypothetical protein
MGVEYAVSAEPAAVNFAASGMDEILQNLRTIITTAQGSVPLDRGFGVDFADLDVAIPIAQARLTARIVEAIHQYEPRVEVTAVTYAANHMTGQLMPTVRFRLREGGEAL